jgi:catechol 2,3-dioxygenase-like lactoylglutathione lyase family enzyme
MLDDAALVAFAATTQPDASRTFYADTLGLTMTEDSPFALVFDANGTTLRIQKVQEMAPPGHTVLGWEVADMTATIESLTAAGVEFVHFDPLPQDAHGVWTTPDGTRVAWFRDPDGNLLSLTETA